MPAGKTFTAILSVNHYSPVRSIVLSNIPSGYSDLLMTMDFSTDRDIEVWMRFNSDTGSNYGYSWIRSNQNSASGSSGGSNSQTYGAVDLSGGYRGSALNVWISEYTDTSKFKTYISRSGGWESTTNNYSAIHAGTWRNTTAINSITLTLPSTAYSFYEGSVRGPRITLYGITEA